MTQAGSLLRWRSGLGWLVLVGGGSFENGETEVIDSHALSLADADKPVAFVPTALAQPRSEAAAILEYIEDFGGPAGYVVPLWRADDANRADVREMLAQAGLILLGEGEDRLELAQAFAGTRALDGLAQAFATGAVVYGIGEAAPVLGAMTAETEDASGALKALGWLGDAFIEPHFTSLADSARARSVLEKHPHLYCLGIPDRVALALGPAGEVETWGAGKVTVTLGTGWIRK